MATGLAPTPNKPEYHNAETFGDPPFYVKDFCKHAPYLEGAKSAMVIGDEKSAYDVAGVMTQDGALVDLVTRPEGHQLRLRNISTRSSLCVC